MNDYRDYLAHHGVKGMRWGIRRERQNKPKRKLTKEERNRRARLRNTAVFAALLGGNVALSSINKKREQRRSDNYRRETDEVFEKRNRQSSEAANKRRAEQRARAYMNKHRQNSERLGLPLKVRANEVWPLWY